MSAPAAAFQRTQGTTLLGSFHGFWKETLVQRSLAQAAGLADAAATASRSAVVVSTATPVRERMSEVLRQQVAPAIAGRSVASADRAREAIYVMAALADEVFLTLDWRGRAAWQNMLLETEFFRSRDAGETIFSRIDLLLRNEDPDDRELAAIYLNALALGFRGRFMGIDDIGVIEAYKSRLSTFIAGREPQITSVTWRILPDCYASTVQAGTGRKLSDARLWALLICGVLVLWLAGSTWAWDRLAGPLKRDANTLSETKPAIRTTVQ